MPSPTWIQVALIVASALIGVGATIGQIRTLTRRVERIENLLVEFILKGGKHA